MNSTYCVQDSGLRTTCCTFSHTVKTAPEGSPSFDTDTNCDPRRWPGSGAGLTQGGSQRGQGSVGLLHCPRAHHCQAGPHPSSELTITHVDLVDLPPPRCVCVGGGQRPLPTRQSLYPSDPSRTLMFLSYALRGATLTGAQLARADRPRPPRNPHSAYNGSPSTLASTSPHLQLCPNTQFHKRSLKSVHPIEHNDPHEDTPF